MQKIIMCSVIAFALLASSGCVNKSAETATPEAAQRFLKLRGYDFDKKSFFAAAQERDIMAIKGFLDAGMDPNTKDIDSRTVLISAAARGDLEITNILLSRGADPNVKDLRHYTALSHAVEAMYEDVVEALLNHPNVDPNCIGLNARPVLSSYVWRDNTTRVEKMLARGANANAQDADGDTALHGAAQIGNVDIIRMLLDKGANINAKNHQGGTPLMWAAVFGNEKATELLLSRGADASLKDNDGITAAGWAVRNKRENVVQLLRRKR